MRFIVVGPYSSLEDLESHRRDVSAVWELSAGDYAKTSVEGLPSITYGTIPAGFEQIIPQAGFPLPLEEGKLYIIGTPTIGADFGVFCFKIEKSQAMEIPCRER